MDPHWGRVIHQTLPSLPSLTPPIQEGSGNQTRRFQYAGVWGHALPPKENFDFRPSEMVSEMVSEIVSGAVLG